MTPPAAAIITPEAFHGPAQSPAFPGLIGRIRNLLTERSTDRPDADPWELTRQALDYAAEAERLIARQKVEIAQLRSLSVTDELTGLHNRRGFFAALERTLGLARRHGGSGVVVYLDLDDFKGINDSYGHDAGDAVLCHVADILAASVRSTDVVARLGGDEFAVLLVEAARPAGDRRARALQEALNRSTVRFRRRTIPIRVSLGLESYDGATDAAELLRRADHEMYCDKRIRNRASGRSQPVNAVAAIARRA